MKITSVDVIRTNPPAEGIVVAWSPVFVRINTDAGICGYGEAGVAYSSGPDAAAGMIADFAKYIIGMDPTHTEEIWNRLHRDTFWGMGGGTIVMSAISAIDIACWDIKGKKLNAPVHELLGGKMNTRLRAYASQIQTGWGPEAVSLADPADYAQAARDAMADGYDCVKVDPVGFNKNAVWMEKSWNTRGLLTDEMLDVAYQRVAAIREAGGPDLGIIIELHALTDTNSAIQLGKRLEPLNCFYYEEPTQPLNPDLFAVIAQNISIPLAAGERIYSRWGYRPFFENRSLSVIQPDLCNCGGLSEGKKICDMAHVYDVGVQIHICGGPISTAAALQLEAVIPNFLIHEQHHNALLKENIDMCTYDYQPKNGYFEVPDLPGIGNEVTEETIRSSKVITVK
ncbi:mandelate racemase/muconate lactonizing enzyme family protein [Pseudoflavonifractor phocaeensis]|uniref:mandelate racemase/muconate lactonizing enzyme family protein n=1 Tax=Pseudoflavonifractor phocaeensis TaxID=1870988 RepID=UPI00313DF556